MKKNENIDTKIITNYDSDSNRVKSSISIFAPTFVESSAGISTLYKLKDYLQSRELKVFLIPIPSDLGFDVNREDFYNINKIHYDSFIEKEIKKNIAIIPDTVASIPFKPAKAIRYLLNREGYLPQSWLGNYHCNFDMTVSYSSVISKQHKRLYINNLERPVKKSFEKVKDNKVLVYFGKNKDENTMRLFIEYMENNSEYEFDVVERNWPTTKFALKSLIKKSQFLLTFDPLTLLTHESIMLGTPAVVVIPKNSRWKKSELLSYDLPHHGILYLEEEKFYCNNKIPNITFKQATETYLLSKKIQSIDLNRFYQELSYLDRAI